MNTNDTSNANHPNLKNGNENLDASWIDHQNLSQSRLNSSFPSLQSLSSQLRLIRDKQSKASLEESKMENAFNRSKSNEIFSFEIHEDYSSPSNSTIAVFPSFEHTEDRAENSVSNDVEAKDRREENSVEKREENEENRGIDSLFPLRDRIQAIAEARNKIQSRGEGNEHTIRDAISSLESRIDEEREKKISNSDWEEIEQFEKQKYQLDDQIKRIYADFSAKFEEMSGEYLKRVSESIKRVRIQSPNGFLDENLQETMERKERKRIERWNEVVFNENEIPCLHSLEKEIQRSKRLASARNSIVKVQALVRGHQFRRKEGNIVGMALKRRKIAKEIMETEKFYCDCLDIITNVYEKRFRSEEEISSQDCNSIFSNANSIRQVNHTLLKEIREKMEKWSGNQTIGDVFHGILPMFKLYSAYINNYENGMEALGRYSRNPSFLTILEECRKEHPNFNLNLESLLIMPIQRIPRYELLLQEYLKNTEKNHHDYPNLREAVDSVHKIGITINESKRRAENLSKIIEIQRRLEGTYSVNLVEPHRTFVKEGSAFRENKENATVDYSSYLFLFSDAILVTQKKRSLWSPSADDSHRLIFKELVPIDNILTVSGVNENREWCRFGFELITKGKSLRFFFKNQEETDNWMDQIVSQASLHLDRRKSLKIESAEPKKVENLNENRDSSNLRTSVKLNFKKTIDAVRNHIGDDRSSRTKEEETNSLKNLKDALILVRRVLELEEDVFRFPIRLRAILPEHFTSYETTFITEQQTRTRRLLRKLDQMDYLKIQIDSVIKNELVADVLNRMIRKGMETIGELKDVIIFIKEENLRVKFKERINPLMKWYIDLSEAWDAVLEKEYSHVY
eukprot:TRINITY_DN3423_c0_g1_i1.p1 TRINITY_DN3423_c0_g1~~TRINITY_DN3423_c0_g1_i1.p1  ORF type:complete len:856 (+),score=301.11 TRINITY_DN3423_c0_g1_i1:98-2665(+)